jgi:hypothetical protein
MDELIALRREELEAYKDLTQRELQLKQKKLENSDPNNDPYSMSKCMAKLKNLSLSQADHLKVIMFLKRDREDREIFMSYDEIFMSRDEIVCHLGIVHLLLGHPLSLQH